MILTVANIKGGSSKTTSAAYVAHALAEAGHRVLVVDADPQGSITRWAEMAGWSIPVRGMATGRLHDPTVGVAAIESAGGHDCVVIDTPGTDKQRGIVESAIRAATHVLVPVAPAAVEYERLPAMAELIADVSHLGRHGAAPLAAALLTRTIAGASSVEVYRRLMARDGWLVIRPTVARLERYAQSFGAPVHGARSSAYGDALTAMGLPA